MLTLTPDQIDALRKYNTPTIANAIETFNVRGRHLGFLPHQIRSLTAGDRPDCRLRGDLGHPR